MKIPDIVIKEYLKGKTIYSFGDSLVYGLSTGEGILDGLCNTYEMNYNKYAINGGSIIQRTNKIITQVEEASVEQPDFVVFDGMINDTELPDASIGTISNVKDDSQDKTTFCGAYEHLCYTLQQKYSNAHIIYVTPHRMPIRALAAKERLHSLVLQMCEKWEIPVVDIYTISDIDTNIEWMRIAYSVDADNVRPGNGLHLTGEGYDLYYAPFVLKEMTTNINMNITQQIITLNAAKQDIKAAIIEKGQPAGDNMHEYTEAIDNISSDVVDEISLPIYLEAVVDGEISMENFEGNTPNVEYSLDNSTWTTWDYSAISVQAGDKVYFRGNNATGIGQSGTKYSRFLLKGAFNSGGNINSLLAKEDFDQIMDLRPYGSRHFFRLFQNCVALKTPCLLPAKILAERCYHGLFTGTSLTSVPALPATQLAQYCYAYMLDTIETLEEVPYNWLPITTLLPYCYAGIFTRCSALKKAPYLPAKTLVTGCYTDLFFGCSSLQYIKADFTTAPTISVTNGWVNSVASTGCFIKAKDATWTTKGTSACPSGWTLITSAS